MKIGFLIEPLRLHIPGDCHYKMNAAFIKANFLCLTAGDTSLQLRQQFFDIIDNAGLSGYDNTYTPGLRGNLNDKHYVRFV